MANQSGRTISFQLSTSNTDKLANVNHADCAWPLARQPCKVDCDLDTIERARIIGQFLSGRLGHCVRVWLQSFARLCLPDQNLCQNGTFSSNSNRPDLYREIPTKYLIVYSGL